MAATLAASWAGAARADTGAYATTSPSNAMLESVWPARLKGVGGRAAFRCQISAEGVASDCTLVDEYPSASSLGQALRPLIPAFKLKPATHDGRPIASSMVLVIGRFPTDKEPNWLRKPTASDLLAVFPREALRRGTSGQATVACLVGLQGALFDCLTLGEAPQGMHFGDAALALTPQFLMRPATKDGKPVVAEVRIPINFKTSGPADPGPATPVVSAAMVWAEAPTYADVIAAYPEKAKAAHTGGRATLYCEFLSNGRLKSCSGVNEEPFGKGFHAAAMKLIHKFRAYPPADGKGFRDATIQLPFTFPPAILDGVKTVGRPLWAGLPTAEEVTAAFAGAPKNVGTVRVLLNCSIEQGGAVTGCKVTSETPAGKGFGQAALALAAKVRISTWTNEGLPVVGGEVNIPIRFETGDPAAAAPAPAKP